MSASEVVPYGFFEENGEPAYQDPVARAMVEIGRITVQQGSTYHLAVGGLARRLDTVPVKGESFGCIVSVEGVESPGINPYITLVQNRRPHRASGAGKKEKHQTSFVRLEVTPDRQVKFKARTSLLGGKVTLRREGLLPDDLKHLPRRQVNRLVQKGLRAFGGQSVG
jgi:hypothetical protein